MATAALKAPFPAIGGKGRVAELVWSRFGDPANYIEPFCFSAAMLLRRPTATRIETINDANAFCANFWRATQADPDAVADAADWPVNEADLHSRHRWLVHSDEARGLLARVKADPDFFDPKIAGWWAWGACCWIGSGWCEEPDWEGRGSALASTARRGMLAAGDLTEKRPHIGGPQNGDGERNHHGAGVHARGEPALSQQMPMLTGHLGTDGRDIHDSRKFQGWAEGRPQLADAFARGRGVHGNDGAEVCADRRAWLRAWFGRLRDRTRVVRVCCGDWLRVCDSDSVTTRLGTTAVFLDPPYRKRKADGTANRSARLYANDRTQDVEALVDRVIAYCLERGDDPRMRIAVCCLEGEGYEVLAEKGWSVEAWKSSGYGNRSESGSANRGRERIWFSPHCLDPEGDRYPLFD